MIVVESTVLAESKPSREQKTAEWKQRCQNPAFVASIWLSVHCSSGARMQNGYTHIVCQVCTTPETMKAIAKNTAAPLLGA